MNVRGKVKEMRERVREISGEGDRKMERDK